MKNIKTILIAAVLFLGLGLLLGYKVLPGILTKQISANEAKVKITDFLKSRGYSYEVVGIEDYDNGLYKATVATPQGDMPAFITKSGNSLSFSIVDLSSDTAPAAQQAQQPASDPVKNDKPAVELFVMSHCPYGTQIEKGMLPVLEALGDKIDFQLKFVNYAMHGQKEIDEQLNQYCINELYPSKFNSYLSCFLESGEGEPCLTSEGLSTSQIASCVSDADKEFGISESYEDKSTWKGSYPMFGIYNDDNQKYSVAGSPTLVINGVTTSSGRSPSALLTAICSSFEDAPEECSTELSTDTPAPGFGSGTAGSTTDASCN